MIFAYIWQLHVNGGIGKRKLKAESGNGNGRQKSIYYLFRPSCCNLREQA